ncbi:hypothetical protein [Myxosarcina sp. GI1(2024)]
MYSSNVNLLANSLGVLSLIGSSIVFYPAIASTVRLLPNYKILCWQTARLALMVTIFLGLVHGLLMTQKEDIDFNELNTYWVYAEGLLAFNLLIFLAFTFSELKRDLKKLIYFTYAGLFLLGCHVWQQIAHLFG